MAVMKGSLTNLEIHLAVMSGFLRVVHLAGMTDLRTYSVGLIYSAVGKDLMICLVEVKLKVVMMELPQCSPQHY